MTGPQWFCAFYLLGNLGVTCYSPLAWWGCILHDGLCQKNLKQSTYHLGVILTGIWHSGPFFMLTKSLKSEFPWQTSQVDSSWQNTWAFLMFTMELNLLNTALVGSTGTPHTTTFHLKFMKTVKQIKISSDRYIFMTFTWSSLLYVKRPLFFASSS